ncbi:head maturation protease, ClpP-related [Methylobacterium nodulans]|uniref:ATP-dependent Clp protease proteolytic subunit n=1 Tax=Methylobacterium nodulans (strain LMG 21967 / CNCM I-2342 / ORS 2060) TaxID=460265 RepID=B8IRQ1_METNO|nr:head maturation protease, ClpP-related [Methylobacterium nodulans]ACL60601.1 peptidase S14 ClpP [Methylobacterium nodulans ORS 2060]
MAVLVNGTEIVLSGTVGNLFWDDSFDAADVILALAQVGRGQDVTIRLNSGGGIATEGAAIHAALCAHRGRKTIIVEGVAASAASVIAMAGDEIVMARGAVMMIHDPSGFTFGPVSEHEVAIRMLTSLATAMAGIYAERSGKTPEAARADMQAELWMAPEEAVAAGYADRVQTRAGQSAAAGETSVDAGRPDDETGPEPTAFDFRLYKHAPERLVALADRRAWTNHPRLTAALPAAPTRQTENPMATASAGGEPAPHSEPTPNPTPALPAASLSRADAAEIATLCLDGGVPALAASLLAEGATVEQARSRITAAQQIRDKVALARRGHPAIPDGLADEMIAQGKTVEQAVAVLFDKMAARDEETQVRSHHVAEPSQADGREVAVASMRSRLERMGITQKEA